MAAALREDTSLRAIIDRLRKHGFALVTRSDVHLLCPDHLSASQEFDCLAAIARQQGWSFAFQADRAVLFRPLPSRD